MTQKHPGLAYAESLGFQSVYDEAVQAQKDLDTLYVDLDKAQDERRFTEDHILDREMHLLSTTQAANPDWSANKVEQQMRVIKHEDGELQELRKKLSQIRAWLSGLEIDKDLLLHTIRIRETRMTELGGYFNFLAALKQAENLTKTTPQE